MDEVYNYLKESFDSKDINKELDVIDKYLQEFDINSVPLEIRKKQYKDYRPIFDFVNRECRDWNLDENLN